MHRKALLAVTTAASVMFAAGSLAAEEWKFAHEESDGDVQDIYAEEFKRLIEEKTDGDVTVTIYTYGQLGNENDITELTANGAVQFSNASPGHLGSFVPEIQVLLIPYLLSENEDVNKEVLSNSEALYGELSDDFESKGLKLFDIYPEGEMVWTTKKEVRSPEDLSGVKFRVMTSPLLVEAYDTFGADPVALPWGEVYSGLQLNTIDAQVNPIFFIESAKFYEVTDYLIWTGEQEYTTTVVANADFWSGLSEDHQDLLMEVRSELTDFIYEEQKKLNDASRENIKEAADDIEFIELTADEREAFAERAKELDQFYINEVGGNAEEVVNKLRSEIAETEEKMGAN